MPKAVTKKCKWCHGARHVTPAQLTKYLKNYAEEHKAKRGQTMFAFVALYLTKSGKPGCGDKVCYVCPGCGD